MLLCGTLTALLAGLAWFFWPGRQPHVLLITLDTTRADRLGCYGYSAAQTPALDSLAARGVLCERAFTVAPITLPSHTTMFTGLYPAESGVVTNGRGRLADGIPTLAEVLERQGYDTGAFVASFVLNHKFGLDRGFRTYDDDFDSEEPAHDALHRQRHAAAVVDAALAWLGQKRSRPFFCWVHLYDPHAPYLIHTDSFGDKFVDRPYDAEIAYVDQQVGRLTDFLKFNGLDSQTLVVVVGDHGEGLGEHGERAHGMTLYDDALHVPLIFRQVGRLPARRRIAGNLSLVDLSPTILDLLGMAETRKLTGKSLKSVLAGSALSKGPIYGATDDPFLINGWSPLRCLIDGQWKYIRTTKRELYNLTADPHERQNLLESDPATARIMESQLAEFESRLAMRKAVDVQLSPKERQALKSLGYLGASKTIAQGDKIADRADVKDMLPFANAMEDAVHLTQTGSVQKGIEHLREIVRNVPDYRNAALYLAGALLEASELDEAEKILRALLIARPDSSDGHCGLGAVLMQRGLITDAMAEFRTTIEIDPDNVQAHYNLAQLFLRAGQPDSAMDRLNTVLEIDSQHSAARRWRANLLVRLGRTADAIADYRASLKYEPENAEANYNLGALLAAGVDPENAGRHLARAVELNPLSAEMQYGLGAFLLQQRRHDAAIKHLTKAIELKPGLTVAVEGLEAARAARAANVTGMSD
jgi:arylsulfatase A-like enzyme/Tfp pilus assembly protein PilF